MVLAAQSSPLPPNGLQALQELLHVDLQSVNAEIIKRMHSRVDLIPQLASHLIAAGGKRLRPLLTLASAKLFNYGGARHVHLAACVEFIHTATLLHDDVVDESRKRRGLDTANEIWGNKASVLVGDFLFSRSFELMVEDGSLEVLRILSGASSTIAEGEVAQLLTANNMATSERDYLDVIGAKTAALFAAACEIGAVIADRSAEEQEALRLFGENLGLAFQITDDVMDYKQDALGKNMGDDFRDGKVTLPIIYAFEKGDSAEKSFWKRCIEEQEFEDKDLTQALAYLAKHRALEDSIARARGFAGTAHDALKIIPESAVKAALLDAASFSVARASA